MTKAELIAAMAKDADISKAKAEKVLSAFIDAVTGALKKGDKVTLVGFGTFSVAKRAARSGRPGVIFLNQPVASSQTSFRNIFPTTRVA